jgi:hypothetical protein
MPQHLASPSRLWGMRKLCSSSTDGPQGKGNFKAIYSQVQVRFIENTTQRVFLSKYFSLLRVRELHGLPAPWPMLLDLSCVSTEVT